MNQTKEEKKNYLNSYLELMYLVEQAADDAGYWKEIATTISATHLEASGIKSKSISRFNPIDKFLEIAERCSELGEQAQTKKEEIQKAISKLENPQYRLILELRYIGGFRFYEIAKRMKYSLANTYTTHRNALDSFEIPES